MSAPPDLFATAIPGAPMRGLTQRVGIGARRDEWTSPEDVEPVVARAPPFDPINHPCAVCGAANAPFGEDYPRAPRFYCRGHREEERRDIFAGDADRGS
jgi:hypothetical protein